MHSILSSRTKHIFSIVKILPFLQLPLMVHWLMAMTGNMLLTLVVQREALQNAVSASFSSLLCIMALTSVTGMKMTTVYPENNSKESKYSKFMNGTILPRATHNLFSSKLHVVSRWATYYNVVNEWHYYFTWCGYNFSTKSLRSIG